MTFARIQCAMLRCNRAVDFLRGDEPYKADGGGEKRLSIQYRILQDDVRTRLQHSTWCAGQHVRKLVKSASRVHWLRPRERSVGGIGVMLLRDYSTGKSSSLPSALNFPEFFR
jgi:hypothetical protein